jgi:prolyl oligopeptidase
MKKYLLLLLILALISHKIYTQNLVSGRTWVYPSLDTDTVIDCYFNKKITDPYRILEDLKSDQVKIWIKQQNKLYDNIVYSISNYDSLQSEINKMWKVKNKWNDFPRFVGKLAFYAYGYYNDPSIERLGYSDDINNDPIELFNTKALNEKDSCIYTINYYEPSLDGKYIAFGISPDGSEKASIFIMDVKKKEILPDRIQFSLAGNIQWLSDNSGFFYAKDKDIKTENDKNTFRQDGMAVLHILHTDSKQDRIIVSRQLNPNIDINKENRPRLFVFPSSRKVLLNLAKGSYYVIYYASLEDILTKHAENVTWKKICTSEDKMGSNVMYGDRFFGISFNNNPNGQLFTMKLPDTTRTVIYEASNFFLDDLALTRKGLYVSTLKNGLSYLVKISLENFTYQNIDLPFYGGLRLIPYFPLVTSYQATDFLFFTIEGYTKQKGGYICDIKNNVIRTSIFPEFQFTESTPDLVEEEIEVPSYDGTMVPLSIIYKKGTILDGSKPLLLEAYGAYGHIMRPLFNMNLLLWYKQGGIFAVAHVRGGSEKGDIWYKGGYKATKPNSWKDLIACSEYLVKNKYTMPQKMSLSGTSAGGITIGRAITERPDLYKAAVMYVGWLNTIRLENTFNPQLAEFGTVKDSLEFKYLYEMDTYQHIKEDVGYPSLLITTGLNDSRVAPWQPAKAVAKFQEVSNGENIVLFRVADRGHFDYPSDAEVYSFLLWQLGDPDFQLKP